MRCLSLFIYKTESNHKLIRNEICMYIENNIEQFSDFIFETEIGILDIYQYINYIKKQNSWDGQLEKYIAEILYKINIVDYKENILPNNKIIYEFVANHNYDDNYNKDLCVFTQVNNNHFKLIFDINYNFHKTKENNLIAINKNKTLIKQNDNILICFFKFPIYFIFIV